MGYIATLDNDTSVNETSVNQNIMHARKIIRNMNMKHVDFEFLIYDRLKNEKKCVNGITNALYNDTKERTIRQHLIIKNKYTLISAFTYSAFYPKSSLFGSNTNVEIGYLQLNTGNSYGDEPEYVYYIRCYRPLASPYSKMAGGFEFSKNWSQNINPDPDSPF